MAEDANETPAPEVGSEEYNAQMVAKAEAPVDTGDVTVASKPEAVPDKFWDTEKGEVDYEAWGKSTSELEAKFTEKQQESGEPNDEPADDENVESTPITQEALDRYTQEFTEGQALSEQSYDELAKAGIPKEIVDTYVQGLQALQETSEATTLAEAGFAGRDAYDSATKWAAVNLSPEEVADFNEAVASTDPAVVTQALSQLNTLYSEARGTTSSSLLNGESASPEAGGYASVHEMTTAMSDPRYAKDPAYRQQVAQKIALSNL